MEATGSTSSRRRGGEVLAVGRDRWGLSRQLRAWTIGCTGSKVSLLTRAACDGLWWLAHRMRGSCDGQ